MNRRKFLTKTASVGVAIGSITMPGTVSATAKAAKPKIAFETISGTPALQLRHKAKSKGQPVLYVHGGTFPAALSVGYRFANGLAWEDALHGAGFDMWALDFEGYGGSARPAIFGQPADSGQLPLRCADAVKQIDHAVSHIVAATGYKRIAIIAHSWGGIPAAQFATNYPNMVERLVLFAPVVMRKQAQPSSSQASAASDVSKLPAWTLVTVDQQLKRFVADTPKGETNVLAEPELEHWAPKWLATDPASATHSPPAVKVPGGPTADFIETWNGVDLYDPALLKGDILFVRGAWDSVSSEADAKVFKSRAVSANVTLSTIPRSGHLAHLETNRAQLWAEVNSFLKASKT